MLTDEIRAACRPEVPELLRRTIPKEQWAGFCREHALRRDLEDGAWWHLSLRLWPPGRSSTDRDWAVLGAIVAHVSLSIDPAGFQARADEPPLPTGGFSDDPSATIHWWWPRTEAAET